MATNRPHLAVLGLGTMGQGMATSALRSGIPTVVWNRSPEAAGHVVEHGAELATSAAAAVEGADVVITMATDAAAVEAIAV